MSDITATADAYVASWNQTEPARRLAAIAAVWAENGVYRDPLMKSDGHAGIDAMIAGVQQRFAGFVLKRTSKVDGHNGSVRFTWSLGPAGDRRSSRAWISVSSPRTASWRPSRASSTGCRASAGW